MNILSSLTDKEQRILVKATKILDEAREAGGLSRLALVRSAYKHLESHVADMHAHVEEFSQCYQAIGWELVQLREVQSGIACFDRAIALAPADARSWSQKAVALELLADHEAALRAISRATELEPLAAHHWKQMGEVYEAMGRTTEAANALRQAIVRDPTQLELYDRILQFEPQDGEVQLRKAFALVAAGRSADGLTLAEGLLTQQPPMVRARLVRVDAYEAAGNLQQALHELDAYLADVAHAPEQLMHRASLHRRLGALEESVHDLDAALRVAPDSPHVAAWWCQRSEDLAALGRWSQALDSIERALSLVPADRAMATLKGRLQLGSGDVEGARRTLEEVLLQDPHLLAAVRAKAVLLQQVGDLEGAAAYLDQLLETEPNAEDLRQRADVAMVLDQVDLAIDCYRSAIDRKPQLADIHAALAEAYASAHRYEEAEVAFGRQVRLVAHDAQSWQRRGEMLYYLHRFREARESLLKALELSPSFEEATQALRLVEEAIEGETVEQYCRQLLYYEDELGRRPTKEEVFKLGIPFDMLDKVQHFIDTIPHLEVYELPFEEWEELERISQQLVPKLSCAPELVTLAEVARLLPQADIHRGKEVLGYLRTVATMEIAISPQVDLLLEQRARTVLELPEGERTLPALVGRLGVGLHEAGEILTLLRALRGEKVTMRPDADVPKVALEPGSPLAVGLQLRSGPSSLAQLQALARTVPGEASPISPSTSPTPPRSRGTSKGRGKKGPAKGAKAHVHAAQEDAAPTTEQEATSSPAGGEVTTGRRTRGRAAHHQGSEIHGGSEDLDASTTSRRRHRRGADDGTDPKSSQESLDGGTGDSAQGRSTERRRSRTAHPDSFVDEEGTLDPEAYLSSVLGYKVKPPSKGKKGRGRKAEALVAGSTPADSAVNPFDPVVDHATMSVAEIDDLAKVRGDALKGSPSPRSRGNRQALRDQPDEEQEDEAEDALAESADSTGPAEIPEIDPALLSSLGKDTDVSASGTEETEHILGLAAPEPKVNVRQRKRGSHQARHRESEVEVPSAPSIAQEEDAVATDSVETPHDPEEEGSDAEGEEGAPASQEGDDAPSELHQDEHSPAPASSAAVDGDDEHALPSTAVNRDIPPTGWRDSL